MPIEIKATAHVSRSDASGVAAFLSEYPKVASHGYVITDGEAPEKLVRYGHRGTVAYDVKSAR